MAYNNLGPLYPYPAYKAGVNIASQPITVSTAAVGVTTSFPIPGTDMVTFDVQDGNVRVRWDGTNPTASVGHMLDAGSAYTWAANQFNAAKFIAVSSDAVIFASPMQT